MIAVLAGLGAGTLSTATQVLWAVPLIHQAETFESAGAENGAGALHGHAHGHHHEHDHAAALGSGSQTPAWQPDDGLERTAWTWLTNVALSVGVALILAALFLLRGAGDARAGLRWGVTAFLAFALAPALGLPPELPGTAAASVESRQLWWLLTVACTLTALVSLQRSRNWPVRIASVGLLALPLLVGAPHPEIHQSLAPASMQREFIAASLVSMFLFWVSVGPLTGYLFQRFNPEPGSRGQGRAKTGEEALQI